MTVKELYKKYKDYNIMLFGKPLEYPTIPFTFLPSKKSERENMIVKDLRIEEKEYMQYGVKFSTMKPIKPYKVKGTIMAYCVKEVK